MKQHKIYNCILLALVIMLMSAVSSCSSTSNLDDGEQLYTGLKPIEYVNYDYCQHFIETQEEMEAALAAAPNGALFGSSYYRTPFPYALWIYNAYSKSATAVGKWLASSFGKAPVLMSNVNPELRMSVAESVLQNHGYFRGKVSHEVIYGKPKKTKTDSIARPRTAKIAYTVDMGPLFTLDTVSYSNFQQEAYDMLVDTKSLLKAGDPFDISVLDQERTRIYEQFRNHGYYYYQPSYMSFLADTIQTPGKVCLQLHLNDSLDEKVMRKWVIGRVGVDIRRTSREVLTDTLNRRLLTIHFGGKKPPIRPRVILSDVKLRPGQLFSHEQYTESMTRLLSKGIYSTMNMEFTPRLNDDGTYMTLSDTVKQVTGDGQNRKGAGVLDMRINCVLDKPYDFTLQANYLGKTSGRMGPGVGLGFAKRNAFRGGELLTLNLAANYEFQTGSSAASNRNNYEISGDLTLSMPRLLLPSFLNSKKRRWQTTPSTLISIARETINRSGFFRRHILSSELSYVFQTTKQSMHQFSPLILEYDRMVDISTDYLVLELESPVLLASSGDRFIPKMRYSYRYSSPMEYRNPIYLSLTFTESANLLALGYSIAGKKWDVKDKKAFGTPFSQFAKLEVEWRKTWHVGEFSSLVAHAQGGIIKSYGNSESAPYSEQFYVGGANSIRAFPARGVGPGRSYNGNTRYSYVTNTGDMKLVGNIEYRPRLFGSLYGALFVDMGNVWCFDDDPIETSDPEMYEYLYSFLGDGKGRKFDASHFLNDLALGVGIGIRYDLDFFVLRLDWGFALHTPYSNLKSGYFNMPSFGKGQCLNFAIGYPF